MMFRTSARVLALLVIMGVPFVALAQDKPSPASFIPGEVIVKFSSKTKSSELMAREENARPSEALVSHVRSLSVELGIPLEVKRLGSGGSVILSINQAELISRWIERVRANNEVKEVQALPLDHSSLLGKIALQVEFAKGSPEEKVVNQLAENGRETGPEIRPITEKLQREIGSSLETRVVPSQRLLITVSLDALTLDIVKRLGKRDDVQYAQPNFLLHRLSAADEAPPRSQ